MTNSLCLGLLLVTLSCGCRQAPPPLVATKAVASAYPPLALTAAEQADVTVVVTIDEGGRVTSVAMQKGHLLFDRAALAAAGQWVFNEGAAGRQATITFAFRTSPTASPDPQMLAVFSPPFHIEVKGKVPAPTINYMP